jgi:hypothetical protein
LRVGDDSGTHHTTVFVSGGTRFNYSYFLVRRMRILFASMPREFSPSSPEPRPVSCWLAERTAGTELLVVSPGGMLIHAKRKHPTGVQARDHSE